MKLKYMNKQDKDALIKQAASQWVNIVMQDIMQRRTKKATIKDLQVIPGVGKSLAKDLYDLGIRSISSLRSHDPQVLYDKLCQIRQAKVDRCVLYVFRCAVYFAKNTKHDPKKLKWWNWKDKKKT